MPPRLARWVLNRLLPDDDRDDILSNLDELYDHQAARGRLRARLWFWTNAISLPVRLRLMRDHAGNRGRGHPVTEKSTLFVADVRFAIRWLIRSPGYTLAVIGTLALGFAANTVVYVVVRAVVLRPLPYPDAHELVWVWPSAEVPLTVAQFVQVQPDIRSISAVTAFAGRSYAVTSVHTPDEVQGVAVSTNHFNVYRVPPHIGRTFDVSDAVPGAEPVAAISYELWRSHFGADSSIVGRRVDLFTSASIPMIPGAFTGRPHTVVAVLPPRYRPFGFQLDVMTPLVVDADDPGFANMGELLMVGRLAPQATAQELQTALAQLSETNPLLQRQHDDIVRQTIIPFRDAVAGHVRAGMLVTLGSVGLVLLIGAANVANLTAARAYHRATELAVRTALGASRWRIASQLFTETLVLATTSAAVGFAIAMAMLPVLVSLVPAEIAAGSAIRLDHTGLLFCLFVLVVTMLVSGTLPAVRTSGRVAVAASRWGNTAPSPGRVFLFNRSLVVVQIILATVLAYGAGLLVKSLTNLSSVDIGFSTDVATIRLAPAETRYRDPEVRRSLYARLLRDVRALPDVQSAGAIHFLPIADGGPGINFVPDPADPESRSSTGYRIVTPGYFQTMNIPVVRGRVIDDGDVTGTQPVGVVNRALANQLWPGADPIGRQLFRVTGNEWVTIVGVVGDVRQAGLALPPRPEIYLALAQSNWASAMSIVVRTTLELDVLGSRVRGIVQSIDPNLPITRITSIETILSDAVDTPRFYGYLFSLFGSLALVLGGIGVYCVTSYVVSTRRRDIGVRLALGATRGRVFRQELRSGSGLAMTGLLLGIPLALASSKLLSTLLYDVTPIDTTVLATTIVILATVAVVGVGIPARRAAIADPMRVLKLEG